MNKMATTQDIILELLSDNNLHSIKEIKAKIYEIDSSLLENDNFIYVVLNYLKNKKGLIESGKKGMYRKKKLTNQEIDLESKLKNDENRANILKGWRQYYTRYINKYDISLEMSEEEFRNAKWLYELNKEIEKMIITYDIDHS